MLRTDLKVSDNNKSQLQKIAHANRPTTMIWLSLLVWLLKLVVVGSMKMPRTKCRPHQLFRDFGAFAS